jgi:hypothetical protein
VTLGLCLARSRADAISRSFRALSLSIQAPTVTDMARLRSVLASIDFLARATSFAVFILLQNKRRDHKIRMCQVPG